MQKGLFQAGESAEVSSHLMEYTAWQGCSLPDIGCQEVTAGQSWDQGSL